MPDWAVKLKDGRTLIVEADTQPTPEEAQEALSQMGPEQMAAMTAPPGSQYTPPTPGAIPNPKEFESGPIHPLARLGAGLTDPEIAVGAMPAIGGTVGGIAGGIGGAALAGPAGIIPGKIAGSGVGAGLGELGRQGVQNLRGKPVPEGMGEVAKQAALSAGIDSIAPGARMVGRGLYGAAVRGMPQNLLRESPELIQRGLAEKIPISWAGVQKALGRQQGQAAEALAQSTATQQVRGAGGRLTNQRVPIPEPALQAASEQMGRVGQMAEGSLQAARTAAQRRPTLGLKPGMQTAISTVAGGPAMGAVSGALELNNALRNAPGALSNLGIGADVLGKRFGAGFTGPLRYLSTLKELGKKTEEPKEKKKKKL